MSIRILGEQGLIGIRQKMASINVDFDQWFMYTVDLSSCPKAVKSEKLIRAMEENFQTYEGVATYSGNNVVALLKLGREQEIFLNLVKRYVPDNFDCSEVFRGKTEQNFQRYDYIVQPQNVVSEGGDPVDLNIKQSSSYQKRAERQENRAMIIDDDAYIRTVFSATLKNQFKVTEMSSGNDIENFYKDILPDIIFVDIHLPELDGFGILKKIMTVDPDAYVVVISGDSVQSNVIKAIKMGAKGFLTKPPKRSSLDEYIRNCPTISEPEMATA